MALAQSILYRVLAAMPRMVLVRSDTTEAAATLAAVAALVDHTATVDRAEHIMLKRATRAVVAVVAVARVVATPVVLDRAVAAIATLGAVAARLVLTVSMAALVRMAAAVVAAITLLLMAEPVAMALIWGRGAAVAVAAAVG